MAKNANKTQASKASVEDFLAGIEDAGKQADCRQICQWMSEITQAPPVMWGPAIVGFGDYHYQYESGRSGDWFYMGFSPRKQALTLYLMGGLDKQQHLLKKLGKYKTGKSCIYVNRLSDIDTAVLMEMLKLVHAQWARQEAKVHLSE